MRWAIAGFGWVARDYMAPALRDCDHQLVAVCDPGAEARAAAEALGARSYPHIQALLDNEHVDALYVATPNALHPESTLPALAAGVAVLCEKPMAADLASAERMVAAARGGLLGSAFDQRHHPAHRCLREAIDAGRIGLPTAVRVLYSCWVDAGWSQGTGANWRADPVLAGGGAVLDLAPHGLDLCQFLLDEPVEQLHITLQRRVHEYAVDDGGCLSGCTPSGALYSAHLAYNCPEALPRRRLEIAGERGLLVAEDTMGQTPGGQVHWICGHTGRREPLAFDAERSPFTEQAARFADAVAGRPHAFNAQRDLALTRQLFNAYEKALTWL